MPCGAGGGAFHHHLDLRDLFLREERKGGEFGKVAVPWGGERRSSKDHGGRASTRGHVKWGAVVDEL